MEDSTIDISKLRRYSLGLVVEDNNDNLTEIKVYPVEKLYTDGKDLLKEDTRESTVTKKTIVTGTDATEAVFEDAKEIIAVDKTNYLLCNWLGSKQSNRLTPPNVGKGERVIIYRFSNSDAFYWETEETDLKLRKKEHVVYSYSAKDTLDEEEDKLDDRYTFTISPKTGIIELHTTDKYGEFTSYDITLDTKGGRISIKDGMGNNITLDSSVGSLTTVTLLSVNIVSPTTNITSAVVNIISDVCNINP